MQVRALMRLFGDDALGHSVLRNFDLVAANSAGSLVLAGLVEDLPLSEILLYFLDNDKRSSIFSPTMKTSDDIIRTLIGLGPKYSANAKLPAIQRLLPKTGNLLLDGITKGVNGPSGLPIHLLIVAFDYDVNRAVFFRSAMASGKGWGEGEPAQVTLADVVHASTNAPVNYFDAPATFPFVSDQFWDGGITGCNNPTVVAVVEAAVLGHAPIDLRVLSLGTGSVSKPLAVVGAPPSPYETPRSISTLPNDIKKLAMAILDDPPDAASFIAHVLTGGAEGLPNAVVSRIVRMSPLVTPVKDATEAWIAPAGMTAATFAYLSNIDMDAQIPYDVILLDEYCTAWLGDYAPNQPIRANGRTSDPNNPEIGYAKFSSALNAWRVLFPIAQA